MMRVGVVGRVMDQKPAGPTVAAVPKRNSISGWWWLVGVVLVGAIIRASMSTSPQPSPITVLPVVAPVTPLPPGAIAQPTYTLFSWDQAAHPGETTYVVGV